MAAWPIEELLLRPLLTLLLAAAIPGITRRALTLLLSPRRMAHPFEQAREAATYARAAGLLRTVELPLAAILGGTALAPPIHALASALPLGLALVCVVVALVSGAAASTLDVGQDDPGTPRGRALLSVRTKAFHLGPLVLLALAPALPMPAGGASWLVLAVTCGLYALLLARSGIPIARALGAIRPAPERVVALAAAACRRRAVAPPDVLVLPTPGAPLANAWAFPLSRALVVTDVLTRLDDEALSTVLAHEVSHLAEPRWVSWLRVSGGAVLWSAASAAVHLLTDRPPPGASLAVLPLALLGVVLTFALRRVARRMEARADGHAHEDGSKEAFTRALLFIQRTNLLPLVSGRWGVHDELHDRLRAAGHDPGPRPAPPGSGAAAVLIAAALVLGTVAIERTTRIAPGEIASVPVERAWWRLRVVPADGAAMLAVAWESASRGDVRRARVRVDEAERMGAPPVQLAEARAELLAQEGDCTGAWAAFDESLRLSAAEAFAGGELPALELGGWNLPPSMIEHCAGE